MQDDVARDNYTPKPEGTQMVELTYDDVTHITAGLMLLKKKLVDDGHASDHGVDDLHRRMVLCILKFKNLTLDDIYIPGRRSDVEIH